MADGDISDYAAQSASGDLPAIKNLHERAIAKLEASLSNPTRNYVIFDDKNINIIRKYGLGALMTGGGVAAFGSQGDGGG